MARPTDPGSLAWREFYQRTLTGCDHPNLLERVHALERTLFSRWQERSNSDDHRDERGEMELVTQDLLRVKIEKLGWPTFPGANLPPSAGLDKTAPRVALERSDRIFE
jgi:hypothetical protein